MRTRDINKERAIRDHALKMIVKSGFDGLSMQKLAKAADVSPATIYIYFKDREDLILQLFTEASKKMTEATLKDFDPLMSFSEGLKVQWMNRARYCMANPDEMHFLEQIRHSPLQEKSQVLLGTKFKENMKAFVSNAIKNGELVKVPVEVYWSVAFAPLYTLVQFHIAGTSIGGNKFKFSEKIMLETLALVLKALRP
jgi:TetR/AcrR family transcriptional regulator, multidrug resistance operon repressor